MAELTDYCDVELSWNQGKDDDIRPYLAYRLESASENDQSQESIFPDHLLQLEPISIQNGSGEHSAEVEHCTLKCQTRNRSMAISAIDVLCNARHMEVFSHTGEYMTTCTGIRIDEAIEVECPEKLYLLQYTFEEPTSSFSARLISGKTPSTLWMHSIHVTLSGSTAPFPLGSVTGMKSIDVDKVSARLADMGLAVPEKAQQLMKLMQSQAKVKEALSDSHPSSSSSGPPTLASMMAMLSSMHPLGPSAANSQASTLSSPRLSVSSLPNRSSITQAASPIMPAMASQEFSPRTEDEAIDDDQSMVSSLADVQDRLLMEMAAMERRIVSHFDQQIARVEQRLQAQMCQLMSVLAPHNSHPPLD